MITYTHHWFYNFLIYLAPTNEAFAALPEGTVQSLLLPENIDQLADILKYHVVAANAPSSGLSIGNVETLNGDSVDVTVSDRGIMVNDATVTTADVVASNGIVHIIDKVLMPPADETPVTLPTTTEAPPSIEEPDTEAPATDAPSADKLLSPVLRHHQAAGVQSRSASQQRARLLSCRRLARHRRCSGVAGASGMGTSYKNKKAFIN